MSWRQRAQQLRRLPLVAVLQLSDAHPDRYDPHKWHTCRGVLSVTGAKFMNWNCGQGGGGAIDLVMHLHRLGFGQALEWLENHFGTSVIAAWSPPPQPSLSLPAPCPEHLERVRRYLLYERHLPVLLLEPLIGSGSLYADARANAVFVLCGERNEPVGAELRGTTAVAWRGMAPGSRKDQGYFAIPAAPELTQVVLCESAIDAISCHALHPQYRCLSTAGARPNTAWLPELLVHAGQLYCGFDSDDTGEAMAQFMMRLYPAIQRLPPPCKDWNDALRQGI
ncbi:MAG TPA: DUF3991 and TOPRIM domain-containing protein [Verrucomicrobiae bacterium]|nr:DUF3991 and TOPRIM domain-containing protein [Verrucomicrobiae bacterium]